MHTGRRLLQFGTWLLLALLLGGCATTRQIDTDVQSFHTGPAPATAARYRFERLPSQARLPAQSQWEAVVAQILATRGLQNSDENAQYSVQISAQMLQYVDPADVALGGGWLRHRGSPFYGGMAGPLRFWYRHTARVVVRDLRSDSVVYETIGSFDGPWSDSANLVPVILQAALRDYPNASGGVRRIHIELAPNGDTTEE